MRDENGKARAAMTSSLLFSLRLSLCFTWALSSSEPFPGQFDHVYDDENCFGDSPATCKGIDVPKVGDSQYCEPPPLMKYGRYTPIKLVHLIGSTIHYTCGRRLKQQPGHNESQCLWNGRWSLQQPPRCLCENDSGEQLFYRAIKDGLTELVECLLDEGGDGYLFLEDDFGHSALSMAAKHGHYDMTKMMLDRGAEPGGMGTEITQVPARVAWQNRHYRVARLIVSYKLTKGRARDL